MGDLTRQEHPELRYPVQESVCYKVYYSVYYSIFGFTLFCLKELNVNYIATIYKDNM